MLHLQKCDSRFWGKLNHTSGVHIRRIAFFPLGLVFMGKRLWRINYKNDILWPSIRGFQSGKLHNFFKKLLLWMSGRSSRPTAQRRRLSEWCTDTNYNFLVQIYKGVSVFKLLVPRESFLVVVVDDDDNDNDNYYNMAKLALFLPGPINFKRLVWRRLIPRLSYFPEWS
jgi:hypothetical protein